MDIRLVKGQYKSISSLHWQGIPKFAVITGGNGSGKTQLLELIARSAGVAPLPEGVVYSRMHNIEPVDVGVEVSEHLDARNTVMLRSYWEIGDTSSTIQNVRAMAEEAWNARFIPSPAEQVHPRNTSWDPLWDTLERDTGKHRNDIDRSTFDEFLPPNFVLLKEGATHPSFLYGAVPTLFLSYALRAYFLGVEGGSPEQFSAQFGDPPWVAVNRVLAGAGLRYEVVPPPTLKPTWTQTFDIAYQLQLRNLQSGVILSPNALSSGERVIFLTAIWSYFFNQSELASGAALLLLDEPDAHLHPALTSVFLRVIREELVERRGMRVIATTHSPSTVALTEDSELFVMGVDEPRLRKVTNKWEAVARLTSGLVTVGTHTKAVFVEDKQDAAFYRAVQAALTRWAAPDIGFDGGRALTFIAASDNKGGGGKNSVIGIVTKIETSQVFGVVDRDEDAMPDGRIRAGDRRHLESYLLDPLFIYALLLDENIPNRPNFAPGVDHRNSRSMHLLDRGVLQQIIDGMAELYSELVAPTSAELAEVRYLGFADLLIPRWILECDMKKMLEPLRRRLVVRWDVDSLTQKYEVIGIVPDDLAKMLVGIQSA
ncbi:AAA family ATPase [Niveibacterium sp.]|uniref:AAA family ATPase n=1 Tax=Niveibacterium sp. TaxID=2017444 RepID=UPI0035AF727B